MKFDYYVSIYRLSISLYVRGMYRLHLLQTVLFETELCLQCYMLTSVFCTDCEKKLDLATCYAATDMQI